MEHQSIHHLGDLREAHISRLRALELQAAQFGMEAPPHIAIEIEQIEERLAEIESQVARISRFEPRLSTNKLKFGAPVKLFGLGILLLALMGSSGADTGQLYMLADKAHAQNNVPEYQMICRQHSLRLFFVAGFIVWKDNELNKLELRYKPIGSKLDIECIDSNSNEMHIILTKTFLYERGKFRPVWVLASYHCLDCENMQQIPIVGTP